ncbi:MAG: TMEM175 family protein [Gemmatimonadales bacterium]
MSSEIRESEYRRSAQVQALLDRTRTAAVQGEYELFKTDLDLRLDRKASGLAWRRAAPRSRSDADVSSETARIEAFSDGVFAVAINLLIFQIRVPSHAPRAGCVRRCWVSGRRIWLFSRAS